MITWEAGRTLCELSAELRRQVALLIDRSGVVSHVIVGDAKGIFIPDLKRARSSGERLRGLRCVHTHLRGERLSQDDLTDLALLRLDLMAAITVGKGSPPLPGTIHLAHLLPENPQDRRWEVLAPAPLERFDLDCAALIEHLERELTRAQGVRAVEDGSERVILIHVATPRDRDPEISLEELRELSRSSGLVILDALIQRRSAPDPKTLVGPGKLKELVIKAQQLGADLLLFDQELTPAQVRSLSELTDMKVIDRTQLILDIFAQRAKSRDGKLQVEMAQLKYLLPRLVTQDGALSRLAGGIGTRGPGETKLEIDRRRVRDRIHRLERELKALDQGRGQRRHKRKRKGLPILSIVGYTNAGKSTLLNTLTQSHLPVEDRLFETLDPASRRLRFPRDMEVVVTDTVGFIRDLPRELLTAFRATLVELEDADLLLHVVDVSNPQFEDQMEAVEELLDALGLNKILRLRVFNKMDRVEPALVKAICRRYDAVPIHALDAKTLRPLIDRAQALLWRKFHPEVSAKTLALR